MTDDDSAEFQRLASQQRPSLVAEFWHFLKHNKKWWLLPIVLMLLFLGLIIFLGGTSAVPFIYTIF